MNIVLSTISALSNPKESARITLFLIAKELQMQGHMVRIVATGKGSETVDGIPVYRTSLPGIPFLLHRLHKEKSIDIIHSFSASPLFFLPHLFATGKKVHTLKSYSRTWKGRVGYNFLQLADTINVPTTHFAAKLPFKKNITVINSPIDAAKFFPKDKDGLKKTYGYKNHKIILYYGALWENKGVDVLISAVPAVMRYISNVKFLFLPRYARIGPQQEQVKKLGMERYVEFITNDVAIEDYVNLADAVVLPYRNLIGTEGNPSCLLEAMACKTAVITSDLPELREIAEGCVEFVAPEKVDELAEKIVKTVQKQDKEKIEQAYRKAQEFDAGKIAEQYLDLYSSLSI